MQLTDISKWGKDHWSLLAYFETCIVDNISIDFSRMRINPSKRPAFSNRMDWQDSWGTRLKNLEIPDPKHDDYDVMEELEECGFIKNINTGLCPIIQLTDLGKKTAQRIREHKSNKGTFNTFNF